MKMYPALNEASHHEDIWAREGIAPHSFLISALDGGEWSATTPPTPHYSFDMRLGGPQSWSGRGGEEKNSCQYRKLNPGHLGRSPVTIATELSRLLHNRCNDMQCQDNVTRPLRKGVAPKFRQ